MGTVDRIKERMNKGGFRTIITKPCPICGAAPKLQKNSLDYGNGHGYPGNYSFKYECGGCGIIQAESTTDIYDKDGEPNAEQRAAQDWNEVVDYVNNLIEQRHKPKEGK